MAFEHRHPVSAIKQRISCGNAGDAGSDDGDMCYNDLRDELGPKPTEADQMAPSVTVPESLTRTRGADIPFGGRHKAPLSRSSSDAVLMPESFRGGCSVGADTG